MWKRKPRITDALYGNLMTSFGRVVDLDPFIARPAAALAGQVIRDEGPLVATIDGALYSGAVEYHLRLLAGAWLMAAEGNVPLATAEVFEEAVAWKLGPAAKGAGRLAHQLSTLARGQRPRVE